MPYARAGDVQLYYESFGDGTPFLFVSGTGWPGAPWKLCQIPAFEDRYRAICYDHRGINQSDVPTTGYSTRQFAADAAALLDAIGVTEPAHIIGHSMGGRVCQWLALDFPHKVRSMILAASGSGAEGRPDYPRGLTPYVVAGLVEKGFSQHMYDHFRSPFFFPPHYAAAHPDVVKMVHDVYWENRPAIEPYLRHVVARNQHETGDRLQDIRVPTLVLVGGADRDDTHSETGSHFYSSEYLRDHIPGAEFAVVEDCAHAFFWQKPDEVNGVIRQWVDSH